MAIYDTMEEQIEEEIEETLGYSNTRKYVKISDISTTSVLVVPHTSITNEYRNILDKFILEIELEDDEYEYYRQNPQALSNEVYGTVQYWALILELNHCKSRIDFDTRVVRIYDPEEFEDVIEEILDKENFLSDV